MSNLALATGGRAKLVAKIKYVHVKTGRPTTIETKWRVFGKERDAFVSLVRCGAISEVRRRMSARRADAWVAALRLTDVDFGPLPDPQAWLGRKLLDRSALSYADAARIYVAGLRSEPGSLHGDAEEWAKAAHAAAPDLLQYHYDRAGFDARDDARSEMGVFFISRKAVQWVSHDLVIGERDRRGSREELAKRVADRLAFASRANNEATAHILRDRVRALAAFMGQQPTIENELATEWFADRIYDIARSLGDA